MTEKKICSSCKKLKILSHYRPDDKQKKRPKVCSACAQAIKIKMYPYFRLKKTIDSHKNMARHGDYDLSMLLMRLQWQGCMCAYCKVPIAHEATIDHVIARKHGGKNYFSNILLVCGTCNSSKAENDLKYWLDKKGYSLTPLILKHVKGAYDEHGFKHDHF